MRKSLFNYNDRRDEFRSSVSLVNSSQHAVKCIFLIIILIALEERLSSFLSQRDTGVYLFLYKS